MSRFSNPLQKCLLSIHEKILPQDWLRLFEQFETFSQILSQSSEALDFILQSSQKTALIQDLKNKQAFYEKSFSHLENQGIHFVSYFDEDYPSRLQQIVSAPLVLFYKGNLQALESAVVIAVVGTRKMTSYGEGVIEKIVPALAETGVVIVSGLAFGVDAKAHQHSLQYPEQSVAVLAKGVDRATPKWHQPLFEKIQNNGCVLSEFAFAENIFPSHFPRRNRIVSGLCDGVLVIEAPEKSGALITAYQALQQNRNVYAIPGNLNQKMSEGCLRLITDGAKLVRSATDILEDYHLSNEVSSKQPELVFLTDIEQKILELCSKDACEVTEVYDVFANLSAEVSAALTRLELLGQIKKTPEGKIISQV